MIYHLTTEPKALNGPWYPWGTFKTICGENVPVKDGIVCAITLCDHELGNTHFLYKELCQSCEATANPRHLGHYR